MELQQPDEPSSSEQPKRRACDECRTRKLACSKEPEGCSRCKREGIVCNYSPQKPMGRPRKRAHAEVASAAGDGVVTHATNNPEPMIVQAGDSAMDLDTSFLDDMGTPDFTYLGLFAPAAPAAVYPNTAAPPARKPPAPFGDAIWNAHAGIDFSPSVHSHHAPAPSAALTDEITLEEVSRLVADMPDNLPSLSPQSSNSPGKDSTPGCFHDTPKTNPMGQCGCLPGLYLALDSLQNLPQEVGPAMKTARGAAKAAHSVTECPVCFNPRIDKNFIPPLNSYQVMMMIGALLPTITNAYQQILNMVDAEANRAIEEGQEILFSLEHFGGIWGPMARDRKRCEQTDAIDCTLLPPIMWRTAVRALLRVDLYGVNTSTPNLDLNHVTSDVTSQPGLKDIITIMEDNSKRRHEIIDAMIASGEMKPEDHAGYRPVSVDMPTCMRIWAFAKRSLDGLVIP